MASMHLSQIRRWLLQSPPVEWGIMQLRELLIGALSQGQVPQHVAFVMDGNRRFARSHGIETVEGHNLGFEALARVSPTYIVEHNKRHFAHMSTCIRSLKFATNLASRWSRYMPSASKTSSGQNTRSTRSWTWRRSSCHNWLSMVTF